MRGSLNPKLEIQGVVLDHARSAQQPCRTRSRRDVGRTSATRYMTTVIPRNVRVSEAPSFGKPVLLYDLKCAGSQAYLKLAREVIGRERNRRAQAARRSSGVEDNHASHCRN